VDGEFAASADFKQIVEIRVRAGSHTIQAFNRVFKSKRIAFDIDPGERINFQAANVGGGFFIFFMMLAMGIPRIVLKREVAAPLEIPRGQKPSRKQLL
jgi:hypothetical protein